MTRILRRLAAPGALALACAGAATAQTAPPFNLYMLPTSATPRRVATERLANTVNTALQRVSGRGTWGVLVVSLTSGDTLFDYNADTMLLPASTMKLFTSALALDHFGPDSRFETRILHTGTISNGVLYGDLILRGAGDPTLGGSPTAKDRAAPMQLLARAVTAAGITRITGSLVGDASAFDDSKVPDGWLSRYLGASYAARVSALSFNENKVTVIVSPGSKDATTRIRPAVSGIAINNSVRIVAGGKGARIIVGQDSVTGHVTVGGWIGAKSPARYYSLVVESPALFAVGALKAALVEAGVQVDGPLRADQPDMPVQSVATLPSPTLEEIVAQMNGESNNHFAELLFRDVASTDSAGGSAEYANSLLGQFLADKVHADSSAVFAADGSGLSTLDRVTPRAMVQLLDYARRASWGPALTGSLPIAGKTETLARRMRRTAASGNLRAKTGTTDNVASLGGYVTAANGEHLAFAIIYNGRNRFSAREAIDRIGVALAAFDR